MLRDKILQSKTNKLIIQAFNEGEKVGKRKVVKWIKSKPISGYVLSVDGTLPIGQIPEWQNQQRIWSTEDV